MPSTEARAGRVSPTDCHETPSVIGMVYVGCADKAPVATLGTALSIMSDLA